MPVPVIAIFDVGKTNKKVVLLDKHYTVVHEESNQLPETIDEDGYPCEDLALLKTWMKEVFDRLTADRRYAIQKINFSGYGASLIYLDNHGQELTPLYNYLKPFPDKLQEAFYKKYGDQQLLARQTASPALGSLNAGMQLYRLKYEQPQIFEQVRHALHLPQYLSYLFTGVAASEMTSIGCHTMLWDFENHSYHHWVIKEGIDKKLAPVMPLTTEIPVQVDTRKFMVGIGLHDSSAALIPYLEMIPDPFVLLSTGTWCISLNPFNFSPLINEELLQDCLFYLSFRGQPVKASRVFSGYIHEQFVKRLAAFFHTQAEYYKSVKLTTELLHLVCKKNHLLKAGRVDDHDLLQMVDADLAAFQSYEEAYHRLMIDIVANQYRSTKLILNGNRVKKIFVDGGFSNNDLFMQLLASAFPGVNVFSAQIAQASAIGAAMAVNWQKDGKGKDIVLLKPYGKQGNIPENLFEQSK